MTTKHKYAILSLVCASMLGGLLGATPNASATCYCADPCGDAACIKNAGGQWVGCGGIVSGSATAGAGKPGQNRSALDCGGLFWGTSAASCNTPVLDSNGSQIPCGSAALNGTACT